MVWFTLGQGPVVPFRTDTLSGTRAEGPDLRRRKDVGNPMTVDGQSLFGIYSEKFFQGTVHNFS